MDIKNDISVGSLQRGFSQASLNLSGSTLTQRTDVDSSLNTTQNFASILGGKYLDKINETEDHLNTLAATRAAATYFDKFDKTDLQELLSYSGLDWLLSTEDTRIVVEPPSGLISNVSANDLKEVVILVSMPSEASPLELRELHQIIRELVLGIYVLNECPSITLETNFDQSTTCQLPPGYHDTRIGQLLVSVDYMLKSLWHGVFFQKEKRAKFGERWRHSVNLNSMTGEPETKRNLHLVWTEAGLLDITKDPELSTIYDNISYDTDEYRQAQRLESKRFFMKYIDDIHMNLTFRQNSVKQLESLFLVDAMYEVNSTVRGDRLDVNGYKRIQKRLLNHELFLEATLEAKNETAREIGLLKLISFLVPLFIGLKRAGKIPDLSSFLPPLTHDECKTDRDLPPIVIFSDLKCKNFDATKGYTSLHGGIMFEKDCSNMSVLQDTVTLDHRNEILDSVFSLRQKIEKSSGPMLDSYPLQPLEIDGKIYFAFDFQLETFYPLQPKIPRWVNAYCEEMAKLKPKRLPMMEAQMHEQFRKRFGYQKTVRLKQITAGLHAAANKGLVAIFHTMCRRQPASRLMSQDHYGLSLMHYAAMMDRAEIITQLVVMGCDVNVKKFNNASARGTMPIHYAARSGATNTLACIIAFKGDMRAFDGSGCAPIHHASFFNNVSCLRVLLNRDIKLLEIRTLNKSVSTGLLLASSSGALHATKCLLEYGANVEARDASGNGLVQLAALGEHTNILKYFVEEKNPKVPVWKSLVDMLLLDQTEMREKAARCLETLTLPPESNWEPLLAANAVPALVALLEIDNSTLQALSASILCNIAQVDEVRIALGKAAAVPALLHLLDSDNMTVISRVSVVIADMACVNEYQKEIAAQGGISLLVGLLLSETEHVLVNAVNALRLLIEDNKENQTAFSHCGATQTLIHLLSYGSRRLQANTAACISSIAHRHKPNQDDFVTCGAIKHLVHLFRCKEQYCQLKAARALEALTDGNPAAQEELDNYDGAKPLIRLLKLWALEMKEQGATALWALAGSSLPQQKRIAERIGINILVDMLMTKSEKLQHVSGMALIALGRDNIKNQNRISQGGGIAALVRLLRNNHPPTSTKVLIMTIQVLGYLCVGVAHHPNKGIQAEICNTEALKIMSSLLKNSLDEYVKVVVAMTLSKVVLGNLQTQELLLRHKDFSISYVLELLDSDKEDIKLQAAMALATFAYNNNVQQHAINAVGGISMNHFRQFLHSEKEEYQAQAAFEIVILAKVIQNSDQVSLSALGVEVLVDLLNSDDYSTKILVASLIASLAHTRAGIPDAMVAAGAVGNLVKTLRCDNSQVRESAAVALGYLTFNRTAARILLAACRGEPKLYSTLTNNLGNSKMSRDFIEEWKRNVTIGLPSQSLVINGGPPVPTRSSPDVASLRSRSFHGSIKTEPRGRSAVELKTAPLSKSSPSILRRPKTGVLDTRINKLPERDTVQESIALLRQKKVKKMNAFT